MLRYLASILSSSYSRRAPNPTTSPPRSRIGHSSRRWNRSMAPRWPSLLSPRPDELVQREAGGEQVPGQDIPAGRGVPATEPGRRGRVEAARGEERGRRRRLGGAQLGGVELGGPLVRLQQPGLGAAVALHRGAAALVGELEADPVGEPLDGLDEPDDLDLLQERDRVAVLAAAEAVEGAVAGAHVERRRLLVVERAEALQRTGAGRAQRHVVADDLVDPGAVTDLDDVAVADPSWHGPSLERLDRPPSGRVTRGRRRRCGRRICWERARSHGRAGRLRRPDRGMIERCERDDAC